MKEKKIVTNIIYSMIIQLSAIIAPLITAPYVARVFNADLIGKYSFTYANSNYFAMFESLGLTLYGMILVARERDNLKSRSVIFWEITILKILLTIIATAVFIVVFIFNGEIEYRKLYLIMLFNLLAVGVDSTWFLSGIEEFKVIARRTLLVRITNVVLILMFVKSSNDLIVYALIMQLSTFISYLAIIPEIKKYVEFVSIRSIRINKYFKPAIIYFIPGFITTLFSSTDKTILGMASTDYEVGVYEQAYKICQLLTGTISGISNVLLPRAAYLNNGKAAADKAKSLFNVSIRVAVMCSAPICFGTAAISDAFIPLFFGPGYEKSSILLKILCINVFFISLCNFFGQQALMAKGKQREYNIAISISVIVNIILNIALVHNSQSVGVSYASAVSAVLEFALIYYFGKEMMRINELTAYCIKYIIAGIIMFIGIWRIKFANDMITVVIQIGTGCVIYCASLFLLRDELLLQIVNGLRAKRVKIKDDFLI